MKISALSPWFGSKRTLAPEIIRQLGPHRFYFEGCFGSLAVILAKPTCEHEMACDLHGAITNLAWVVQGPLAVRLFERLQRVAYSDDIYRASKEWLAENEVGQAPETADLDWAYHYFLASWMGRNGVAGTARVNYQIATRWTAGGGSGPLRFRNAVDSIPAWWERLKNVHVLRRDVFDVLASIEDAEGVAIYVDPPYLPETVSSNSRYLHDFGDGAHARLAALLSSCFAKARVVVSYYDGPALASLYPSSRWTKIDCSRHKHLHTQNRRGSKRVEAPEVLLVNGAAVVDHEAGLFA